MNSSEKMRLQTARFELMKAKHNIESGRVETGLISLKAALYYVELLCEEVPKKNNAG